MLFVLYIKSIFWQLIVLKQTELYQELKKYYKFRKISVKIQGVTSWELSLRGNPSDKVLGLVIKTKFYLKIMKFVADFEILVLGFQELPLGGYTKNIDLGPEKPYLTTP